jgi:flagellar biogenesis protein FliO
MRLLLLLAMTTTFATPAMAYIGPGAGLGAIALTVGLVLGVALLLVGFLWYPLKRILRKNKGGGQGN